MGLTNHEINTQQKKLTVIFSCLGKYELSVAHINNFIDDIKNYSHKIQLILVTEGNEWNSIPIIQMLKTMFVDYVHLENEEKHNLFACLINKGLEKATGKYVLIGYPGISDMRDAIADFMDDDNVEKTENIFYYRNDGAANRITEGILNEQQYPLMLSTKIFELDGMFIPLQTFGDIGIFDENIMLQKYFDWEFLIRLLRVRTVKVVGRKESNRYNFYNYPYEIQYNINQNLALSYAMRNKDLDTSKSLPVIDEKNYSDFLNDLNPADLSILERISKQSVKIKNTQYNKKMKIAVIGGRWEYTHNQLCFYNYFDKLYGEGFCTYFSLLDETVSMHDVAECDLVIFSRSRNPKLIEIIDFCKEKKIKTLYMLDDNWLTVAEDWAEDYKNLFVKGNPQFDAFLYIIANCDSTIVYNSLLAEDLVPYAKNIILFKSNIHLDLYEVESKHKRDYILIGYTGSIRYEMEPFKALLNVVQKSKNAKILIFGYLNDLQKKLFRNVEYINIKPQCYLQYCKTLAYYAPDILIAPLDDTRTSKSKCPNKYLEISAVKACGIYSNIKPYTDVVINEYNGILVEGKSAKDWENAIVDLIEKNELRETMKQNAFNHVSIEFETTRCMTDFISLLDKL